MHLIAHRDFDAKKKKKRLQEVFLNAIWCHCTSSHFLNACPSFPRCLVCHNNIHFTVPCMQICFPQCADTLENLIRSMPDLRSNMGTLVRKKTWVRFAIQNEFVIRNGSWTLLVTFSVIAWWACKGETLSCRKSHYQVLKLFSHLLGTTDDFLNLNFFQ